MKNVFKNIFTGIGVIAMALLIIVGLIAAAPVLLVVGGTIIQSCSWVLLFGVVVILPIWCIGKLRNNSKNKQKPAETDGIIDLADVVDKDKEDYEATVKAEYEKKYKEAIKTRYEQAYKDNLARLDIKKARKEKFNRKVKNLKDAITELYNSTL